MGTETTAPSVRRPWRPAAAPRKPVLNTFEIAHAAAELRFGGNAVPLRAIRGYGPVKESARDVDGTLATVAVFFGAAAVFLVLVFEVGWRQRFLVAASLFAIIALAAIIDLVRTNRLDVYRVEILTDTGVTYEFVTADSKTLARFTALLEDVLARNAGGVHDR